jgi:ferredoxin-type protein NapH
MLSPTNRRKEVNIRNYWYVKYAMLVLTLALAWFTLHTIFCQYCPSGSLFGAIPYRLREYFFFNRLSEFGQPFYIHMFTLALTIVFALLITRFWCRYLCPLGAIAGAFNKVGLLTIEWNEEKCKKCNTCLDLCKMGITKTRDIGTSTDCILCGRCIEACPEKALDFKIKK